MATAYFNTLAGKPMNTLVRVNASGTVVEVKHTPLALANLFSPDHRASWYDVTAISGVVVGATTHDGKTFIAPPAPPAPTLAEQAIDAVRKGITLTLSGTITLAATLFPTDAAAQSKLATISAVLSDTGGFPGGAASYPMKDAAEKWHPFTAGQYKAVAGAILSYVAALDLIVDGNPLNATSLPDNAVSVAAP